VEKNGRVREINTVAAFNLRMRRPFADAAIGAKMMQKGVISPMAVLRKGRRDRNVSRIFEKIRQQQKRKA
jgi:heterodisulfide reductase subunit C